MEQCNSEILLSNDIVSIEFSVIFFFFALLKSNDTFADCFYSNPFIGMCLPALFAVSRGVLSQGFFSYQGFLGGVKFDRN